MDLHVSDETAARVRDAVESGRSPSVDSLVSDALDALDRAGEPDLRSFLQSRLDDGLREPPREVTIEDIKRDARAAFESRSA